MGACARSGSIVALRDSGTAHSSSFSPDCSGRGRQRVQAVSVVNIPALHIVDTTDLLRPNVVRPRVCIDAWIPLFPASLDFSDCQGFCSNTLCSFSSGKLLLSENESNPDGGGTRSGALSQRARGFVGPSFYHGCGHGAVCFLQSASAVVSNRLVRCECLVALPLAQQDS
jgi:hypothetical protein